MRPSKFRGRDVHTGEYVYAELGQISEEINPGYLSFITDDDMYTVETDSIAQLVGYDVNGKEVYEGDTVAFFYEGDTLKGTRREWTAVLVPDIVNEKIQDVRPAAFNRLTLKEADQ